MVFNHAMNSGREVVGVHVIEISEIKWRFEIKITHSPEMLTGLFTKCKSEFTGTLCYIF